MRIAVAPRCARAWGAAVVLVLTAGCVADGAGSWSEGDLAVGLPDGTVVGYGVEADAGARVAFGTPTLKNFTDSPATVKDVRLRGDVPSSAAEVVEVRVREHGRGGSNLHATPRWPMPRYERSSDVLDDYVLEPGDVVTFLTVVDVRTEGFHIWPEMEFVYEQDGRTYTHIMDAVAYVCPSDRRLFGDSAEEELRCGE